MTGFDSAFEQVKILVERFSASEKMYLAAEYSEARVRTDFIDKFFTALGWDVNHNVQLNPYEQEVSIERSVNVEGRQQKRSDYAFFLAPNFRKDDVKFYVEAKKPARNLSNPVDYFQTCRYGWSAGTPLAILTDFEEFHILDCRTKPDIHTILDTKRDYFHYKDYLDKEKFAKVYWLFSREAIANNSIEKYVEQLPKPRGKAVQKGLFKGGYQSIDEAFLEELDGIRITLAKAFKKKNPHLGSDELTEMTQKTIDRLVFIRFLEDKQIEPEHYISGFGDSKTSWKDFVYASRKLDAKYNGIVFKKSFIDEKNFIEPNETDFSSVCKELSHVNSPYNFDLIPIHILGSIYERFLGKVVVATDKRVRIDEKPEVRKAGGVYYTPQYIVNYIVENTVGKLIEGKTPKEIAKLRFADISCGSGSFLITVFDKLLEYHKKFYQNNPKEAKSAGCYEVNGKWVLSLKQKQKILTNNIYGVDIDAQAVEVTQLSLYLKLLEDESNATAEETWVMFKEQILPNLNNNIICGNSLIGTDISSGTLFNWEEEKKLKPMNFEDAFPSVMKDGGFDAVVGNPPYYGRATTFDTKVKDYIDHQYCSSEGKYELYQLFIEKTIRLIKKGGYLSFITPQTWLTIIQAKKLREYVIGNSQIESIIYSRKKIFKASIDNIIFTINKVNWTKPIYIYEYTNEFNNDILVPFNTLNKEKISSNNFIIDAYKNDDVISLEDKISKGTILLEQLCNVRDGIKIVGNAKEYAFNKIKINNSFYPMHTGKDIDRYKLTWGKLFCCRDEKEIRKHGVTDIRLREESIFLRSKLLVRKTGNRIICSLDEAKYYYEQSLFGISLIDEKSGLSLHFILGLLNSKLFNYLLSVNPFSNKDTFPQIRLHWLKSLPIKDVFKNEMLKEKYHDKIVESTRLMTVLKHEIISAKTDSEKEYLEKKCKGLDRQIDALVYELYGLTEEEINHIEIKL